MANLINNDILHEKLQELSSRSNNELIQIRASTLMGRIMLIVVIIFTILLFLPWRQTVSGRGMVTALRPEDRPQTVQNQIGGRIEHWAIREGQAVKEGDTILIISETNQSYFDPEISERLREQLVAKQGNVNAAGQKITATNSQMAALMNGLRYQLSAAENKVKQAENTIQIDEADLVAIEKFYETSKARLERYEAGYRDGLFSLTDIESRRLKLQEDNAKVLVQKNKLNSSRQALLNARIDLDNIRASNQGAMAKAQSELGSAVSDRASAQGAVAQLKNQISGVEVRQGLYVVRAPQNGFVVRTLKAGVGEQIKEGESIATLQPESPQVAVEIYVKAMDVPLILDTSNVRLQFEGWPSIQFSGWPAVAVGTFAGKVSVIDRVSSENGSYRILVTQPAVLPSGDDPWPKQLRQGSGVYGRVILRSVPLWYEMWRQLNGFPPNFEQAPPEKLIDGK